MTLVDCKKNAIWYSVQTAFTDAIYRKQLAHLNETKENTMNQNNEEHLEAAIPNIPQVIDLKLSLSYIDTHFLVDRVE